MKKLDDLPTAARALVISTLKDLDGENLKCQNMLNLARLVAEKENADDALIDIVGIFTQYWGFRLGMLPNIKLLLDVLGIDKEDDEFATFLRHNLLGDTEVDDGM